MSPAPTFPTIRPIDTAPIPDLLKGLRRWLPWRAGPRKQNGKFDKIPIDPRTGHNVSAVDAANWVTFEMALQACSEGRAQGIGISMSDQHPVMVAGQSHFLTAMDLDNCGTWAKEVDDIYQELGKPYVEVSPSGHGLRMLGLSRHAVHGGNAGGGKELYGTGRFVTVTGHHGRGSLRDFTNGITRLERKWFGDRLVPSVPKKSILEQQPLPEHPELVATVLSMLDHVLSDTDYDTWRNIIWALASTGWQSVPKIAHQWSARAPSRYNASAVDSLLRQFDPSGGITLGTLVHHARKHGWQGQLSHSLQSQRPPSPLPPPPPSDLLLTIAQLRQIPPTIYAVRGLLPARGLAAIYGEPGSGKSFLALDLAHAISMGRGEWFRFAVTRSPVAYVALEGQGGIRKRMDAVEMHTRVACDDQLRFWCRDLQLLDANGAGLLAAQIVKVLGAGAVVIIDTLNQASPGADENTSQDMGKVIAAAKRLAEAVQGLVIFVHHAGKNRSLGLRGHSSLNPAMDAVIEVVKEQAGRKWRVTKAKDDGGDVARDFDLVPYTVGRDVFGPITSCAVQQTARVAIVKPAPLKGKHQMAALSELRRLLSQPGQMLDYNSALGAAVAVLDAGQRKRDRAKEAIDALLRGGHLLLTEGGVRLAA